MPAPQISPTGSLSPSLSQSFTGIPSGGNPPPWMPSANPAQGGFQSGLGGVLPMGMQMPNASSGDINGTMAQIPGYGNAQSFGPFQNFIPQLGQNLYAGALGGGSMPAPVGGYWNQVAQQMAGPMFGPYGASTLMGTPNPTAAAQQSPLLQPAAPPSSGTPTSLGYTPTTLPTGAALGAPSAGSGLGALGSFGGTTQPFGQAIMNNPLLAQKLWMMSRLPIMRY